LFPSLLGLAAFAGLLLGHPGPLVPAIVAAALALAGVTPKGFLKARLRRPQPPSILPGSPPDSRPSVPWGHGDEGAPCTSRPCIPTAPCPPPPQAGEGGPDRNNSLSLWERVGVRVRCDRAPRSDACLTQQRQRRRA